MINGYQPTACSLMIRGTDLVSNGKLTECLEFVLETMLPDLEMVMESVIEALTTFNEKCK